MIKILELFGGIGACSKALERDREYEIADYVEIDKFAVKSFNAIHGTSFEPQDITKWDKDIDVDLIMHGSPCQDFSVAGRQGFKVKERNLKEKLCDDLIEKGVVHGGEIINHSYTTSEQRDTLDKYVETNDGTTPTLTTRPDTLGYVTSSPVRIRKLTPKECWRLMGFDDEDFDKASKVNSNAQLYKQAGNSIVVDVLQYVLSNLLNKH